MSGNRQLAKNIVYNVASQIFAVMVPLITAPYVARIFDAELVGKYSYAIANSSYFVLLECLGFNLYGQIKVASIRDEKEELSKFFFEILFIKIALMCICCFLYLNVVIPVSHGIQRNLNYILLINIIANGMDITWFINGLEQFKTTALRSMFVRICNIVFVFAFIKEKSDILLYALIMQGATLIAYIFVFVTIRQKVFWVGRKKINCIRHIKPAIVYFIPGLVTTIFSSTDKTMIGIMSDMYEVGIYEQAHKISQICMNGICAIGNVIMPRASYLYHHGNDENSNKADKLFYFSFNIVIMISLPLTFGIIAISDVFVPFFFGGGYEKSAILLSILSFNVFFTSLSNLCGQQLLIARGKQREYNAAVLISALINIVFNTFMIYLMQSIGASIASVVASAASFVLICYMGKNCVNLFCLNGFIWKYFFASFCMFICVKICTILFSGTIFGIVIYIGIGILSYFMALLLLKEELVCLFLKIER